MTLQLHVNLLQEVLYVKSSKKKAAPAAAAAEAVEPLPNGSAIPGTASTGVAAAAAAGTSVAKTSSAVQEPVGTQTVEVHAAAGCSGLPATASSAASNVPLTPVDAVASATLSAVVSFDGAVAPCSSAAAGMVPAGTPSKSAGTASAMLEATPCSRPAAPADVAAVAASGTPSESQITKPAPAGRQEASVRYAPASIAQLQAALGALKRARAAVEQLVSVESSAYSDAAAGQAALLATGNSGCGGDQADLSGDGNAVALAMALQNSSPMDTFIPSVPAEAAPDGTSSGAAVPGSFPMPPPSLQPQPQPPAVAAPGCYSDPKLSRLRALVLLPTFSALRSAFPLNGTFFQTNEVFLDARLTELPLKVPRRFWVWMAEAAAAAEAAQSAATDAASSSAGSNADGAVSAGVRPLDWRAVFFGTSAGSMCRDMTVAQVRTM